MNLEQRIDSGALRVKVLDKRMDAGRAQEFKERLGALIRAGHHFIMLDISEVEFIDSSGLGALVSLLKQLGGQGEIVIGGARDSVASLFKLTRLDKVFQIFEDPRAALEAVAGH